MNFIRICRSVLASTFICACMAALGCSAQQSDAEADEIEASGLTRAQSLQQYVPYPCNGIDQGYDLAGIDPQQLTENFRIELVLSVADQQTEPYATILDINHRTNVGLVIQQDESNNNTFIFGVGDGASSYILRYTFKPGRYYAVVFEREERGVSLAVQESVTLEDCNVMKVSSSNRIRMEDNAYFLPNSHPTIGYNKNFGRYFNGAIYRAKFYQLSGSAKYANGNGSSSIEGYPAVLGDNLSARMVGDFVIKLNVVPKNTQNAYATILDINHRENMGLVIQQDGTNTNTYGFGIGCWMFGVGFTYTLAPEHHYLEFRRDGSYLSLADTHVIVRQINTGYTGAAYFLPKSVATIVYNANYGRYFNGLINDVLIWTPVNGS